MALLTTDLTPALSVTTLLHPPPSSFWWSPEVGSTTTELHGRSRRDSPDTRTGRGLLDRHTRPVCTPTVPRPLGAPVWTMTISLTTTTGPGPSRPLPTLSRLRPSPRSPEDPRLSSHTFYVSLYCRVTKRTRDPAHLLGGDSTPPVPPVDPVRLTFYGRVTGFPLESSVHRHIRGHPTSEGRPVHSNQTSVTPEGPVTSENDWVSCFGKAPVVRTRGRGVTDARVIIDQRCVGGQGSGRRMKTHVF